MNQILVEQMKLLTAIVASDNTSSKLKEQAGERLEKLFLITDMQIEITNREMKEYLQDTSPILQR